MSSSAAKDSMTSGSYADFGIRRSASQVMGVVRSDPADWEGLRALRSFVERDVERIEHQLGRPVEGQRILEIGPGQGVERAHYLGLHNTVEALDIDMASCGIDLRGWKQMWHVNGPGRVVKTIGRELLVGWRMRRRWIQVVGGERFCYPIRHQGDIAEWSPTGPKFDVAVSWSVFEHVQDPQASLRALVAAVRPGGVVMVSIHNYTSFNGHHDIRAFNGSSDERLMWGHLRPSTSSFIEPSAYLNGVRLDEWRGLFQEYLPGHDEYVDLAEANDVHARLLDGEIGSELSSYSRDELLTVNIQFVGRTPGE
jgi:SAM-dependent methyltransferase